MTFKPLVVGGVLSATRYISVHENMQDEMGCYCSVEVFGALVVK
jgi:hypothetical protein